MRGNCYVACEVFYHLMGGRAAGLTPHVVRMPSGETHWFLTQVTDHDWVRIIDPSFGQFTRRERDLFPEIYADGRGCGFLTKKPSARARVLIDMLTWQRGDALTRQDCEAAALKEAGRGNSAPVRVGVGPTRRPRKLTRQKGRRA